MERRANSVLWGELQLICDLVDLAGDVEGTSESGIQLLAGKT